jgi:hypothetical protein
MAGRFVILTALGAALSAASALAVDPPSPAPRPQLICRGGERSLGSHIRRAQRCRTAEQWLQEEEEKGRAPVSLRTVEGQNDGHQASAPR